MDVSRFPTPFSSLSGRLNRLFFFLLFLDSHEGRESGRERGRSAGYDHRFHGFQQFLLGKSVPEGSLAVLVHGIRESAVRKDGDSNQLPGFNGKRLSIRKSPDV